jgi:hypothetical protein
MNKNTLSALLHEIVLWLLAAMLVLGSSIAVQHRVSHQKHAQNGLTQICVNSDASKLEVKPVVEDTSQNTPSLQNNCDACITLDKTDLTAPITITHIKNNTLNSYNSRQAAWLFANATLHMPPARGPPANIL